MRRILALALLLAVSASWAANPVYHTADQQTGVGIGTSISITKPTNLAEGDLILLHLESINSLASASSQFVIPTGFTLIRSQHDTSATERPEAVAAYKIATGSEPATYEYDSTNASTYIISRVTGHDPSTPITVDNGNNGGSTAVSSFAINGVTAPAAEGLLVVTIALRWNTSGSGFTFTSWDGMTEVGVRSNGNFHSQGVAVEDLVSSGATGTRTITWDTAIARPSAIMYVVNAGSSAPTFSGNPTVTNTTDTAITFSYTASASGDTVYGSLRDTADAAFTCAQIIAETDTHGPNSEATTGSADSIILTSADTPELPTYDADFCIRNGASNDSDVFTVSDIDLDAPTGFQFVEITSIGTGSPCESFNTATAPDIVATDWLLAPTTVSPGSYALTISAACQFSYDDSGAGTKQTALNTAVYDQSVGAYHADDIDFIANNNAPSDNGTLGNDPIVLDEDSAMTTLDICSGFDDLDGDQLTITRTGDVSGAHDGAANAAVLTDSGEAWTTDQFVGYTLSNTTDGSSCVVTANTATTATCTLTGGAENDWDIGDAHTIVGALPAGISLGGTGSCDLSGTPTTEDETGISIEFTATDDANDSDALSIKFYVVNTVTLPDFTAGDLDAATTSMQSTFPWRTDDLGFTATFTCHDTEAANEVISQDPVASTEVTAFQEVSVSVSTGSVCGTGNRRLRLGPRIDISTTLEISTFIELAANDAVYTIAA